MGMFKNLIVVGVRNILFWEYIKIYFFFIFKKLFLILLYLKILKYKKIMLNKNNLFLFKI